MVWAPNRLCALNRPTDITQNLQCMAQLDWNATINSIRECLPQTQFTNWFKPLTLIRCDERSVVLGVPSRFHEEWLKSHYSHQLSRAIREQCGSELQLEFEVLVREENVEAALSTEDALPPPIVMRPQLRIVDRKEQAAPPSPSEPSLPVAPNLPTFSHPFLEFDFNHVAYQCALMLAGGNRQISPLIIQAGVGMGKTHLLTEIGQAVHRQRPRARIRYTNAEAFTAEMVGYIKSDNILAFKRKYRDETDCLLFDDIQVLSRRIRTQEELVHIFNEIVNRGGTVAFTSSVQPHRLEEFIEPLKSRLLSGVIAEVKTPTFEERVQILARMCEKTQLIMDPLVLRTLADKGQKDIRELIGTLFRVHLQSTLENRPLDNEFLAREGWAREKQKESITMEEIIALVEHNFGVVRTELMSKSRKSLTTWSRQVAMYLARHYTLLPLEEIGKTFGRDHATVIHAFQKVTETMESQPTRRYEVEFLKQKLQNRAPRPGGTDVPFV
jgi:chromosomal replication initiator protein